MVVLRKKQPMSLFSQKSMQKITIFRQDSGANILSSINFKNIKNFTAQNSHSYSDSKSQVFGSNQSEISDDSEFSYKHRPTYQKSSFCKMNIKNMSKNGA